VWGENGARAGHRKLRHDVFLSVGLGFFSLLRSLAVQEPLFEQDDNRRLSILQLLLMPEGVDAPQKASRDSNLKLNICRIAHCYHGLFIPINTD
jgi:hypothetical protein